MPDDAPERAKVAIQRGDLEAVLGLEAESSAGPRRYGWVAWAELAQGQPGRAMTALDKGLAEAQSGRDAKADAWLRSMHAFVQAELGRSEVARAEGRGARRLATQAKLPEAEAWAARAIARADRAAGDADAALRSIDDALGCLARLAEPHRLSAETLLDGAEVLLDRDGPSDASDAAARLARARDVVEGMGSEDLRLPLALLLARTRAATGDEAGSLTQLEQLAKESQAAGRRDVEWRAFAAAAELHARQGAAFAARRCEHAATEALEHMATALPVKLRESFWEEPVRRRVRARAAASSDHNLGGARAHDGAHPEPTFHRPGLERRTARLLDVLKWLASEHDLERLVERITDHAVELSGAERGFVLLVDEAGELKPWLVRDAGTGEGDPSVAFSRSIAEAVLIDGEPIVTVDARDDRRLAEYLSVHKLMLKSVACVPIRGRDRPVGVLYLEHRLRKGRFGEEDMDLLLAFADQAAIALENARLLQENERRRAELEASNQKLEEANREIERVLYVRTLELEDARTELSRAQDRLRGDYERHGIIGRSEPMRRVFAVIDRIRDRTVPVVIQGESGTGKELIARAIHYGSARAKGPFVAVNCAAIPEALLESELFGHVRGAFTGADRDRRGVLVQASGGTLFLDEVGDMPAKMQVDLLRVLADAKVTPVGSEEPVPIDVRVVCASNKSLTDLVARGQFREDLYYRLNVVELRLPPLRERPEDVPLLCDHFLRRIAERDDIVRRKISRDALAAIAAHPMPGNVRQLEHLLMNACVLSESDTIEVEDLALGAAGPANDRVAADRVQAALAVSDSGPPPQTLDDFKGAEKQRILAALEQHGWNRARAAKALGMPRRTFYRRLKEHDILGQEAIDASDKGG